MGRHQHDEEEYEEQMRKHYAGLTESGKAILAKNILEHIVDTLDTDEKAVYQALINQTDSIPADEYRNVMTGIEQFSRLFAAPSEELRHLVASAAEASFGRFQFMPRLGLWHDTQTGTYMSEAERMFESLLALKERVAGVDQTSPDRLDASIFEVAPGANEIDALYTPLFERSAKPLTQTRKQNPDTKTGEKA